MTIIYPSYILDFNTHILPFGYLDEEDLNYLKGSVLDAMKDNSYRYIVII